MTDQSAKMPMIMYIDENAHAWLTPPKHVASEKYTRTDRHKQNLITETKALRDHCDYLEGQLADLVEKMKEPV